VCPSFYEGFGLPPLEAMACATPVVVSNAASIPEVCADAAVYFNPHEPTDMAQKISSLLKNDDLQVTLTEKGLQHAQAFSWDTCAEKTLEVYKKAL
jgi:glycosyltransferase involved in cell wall biosynthesis